MPRPNRAITALKKRNYEDAVWELLLHEYRCAKSGNAENRLGANALSALISALKDIQEKKGEDKTSDKPNLIELEEWVKKENKG